MENRKKWMEEKKDKIIKMFSDIQLIMDENEDDPAKQEILLHELSKEYKISHSKIMSIYKKHLFNSKDEKFKDITDQPNKPISFVIEEFIPCNSTILLFGNSGIGKSTLTYSWAYHVATGKDWNGRQVKQGKVLIIQLEENEQTTNNRWSHVKDDTPKNTVFIKQSYSGTLPFQLKQSIKEYNPSLIIVDSLSAVNSLNGTNENDALSAVILYDLNKIADKNNVSIIVCHHENKSGGCRGSSAIKAAVSEVIRFYKPTDHEKNKRVLEVKKTRQGENYQYVLEGDENNYLNWTIVGEFNENKANPEKDDSLSKIQCYLNDIRPYKVSNKTIADEIGLKRDTVKKALDRYFKEPHKHPDIKIEREKIDRGYVYSSGVTMRTVELVDDINDDDRESKIPSLCPSNGYDSELEGDIVGDTSQGQNENVDDNSIDVVYKVVEKVPSPSPFQTANLNESVSDEKFLIERMMSYCLQSYKEEEDSKCWEVFLSLKDKWTQEVISLSHLDSKNLWQVTKNRLEKTHGKVFDRLHRLSRENLSKTKSA
ncbi:AAA family ATPase [Cyanobacterium aponinum UTEX 3221]|uniref:AAA family ATPase n=1 Tax=Cyanobacterium aponinum TaxID=379064 RepID=UPI002B4C09E9|nr:AAA family ATPase [Cyanobacterium aponinum]WRL39182.1 AAA family ATPase [Cyanobacterium aponinum UTEX 3221]